MTQPDPHSSPQPPGPPPKPATSPTPIELKRPAAVWTVSILLTVLGALGMVFAWLLLGELGSHGEHVNPVLKVLFYLQLLLSAAQIGSGLALLPGYNVARLIAIVLCVLNLIGGIVMLLTGTFTAIVTIAVNGAMIRQLTRDDVWEWCSRRR